MKIYLDNCALGRLTDEQSQPRIRAEREAVLSCFLLVQQGQLEWVASQALVEEIRRSREPVRRDQALGLLTTATVTLAYSVDVVGRAANLEQLGFGRYDALHLAFAETAGVNALLTTDDRLVSRTRRTAAVPLGVRVAVVNPVDWQARSER